MSNKRPVHIGYTQGDPRIPFRAVLAQMVKARADQLGVTLSSIPAFDIAEQTAAIDRFVQQQVDVLLIGPVDSRGILPAVERANAAGIAVVVVDFALQGGQVACTIGSDNVRGAELSAAYLVEQLGGHGKLAHLHGPPSSEAAVQRAHGFHHVIDRYPGLQLVLEANGEDRQEQAADLTRQALAAHPDLRGIFAANDSMALGAIAALEEAGRTGQVAVVGFDAVPDALLAIQAGRMAATVRQSASAMGQIAVDMALKIARSEPVPPLISTEVSLVTADTASEVAFDLLGVLPGVLRELVESSATLAAERTLLRTLIDNMPDLIYVKDTASRFVLTNMPFARSIGLTTDGMVGKTDFDFNPPDLAAQYYAAEQTILSSGQPLINHEEQTVDPLGNRHWFLSTKVPLQDSDGTVIGLVGIGREITDRKRAEEKLRRYRDQLEELVAARTAELSAANAQLQREIAERHQAEAELAAERNLLRTLIDNLPDLIYVKDTASRFVLANKASADTIGLRTGDIVGKTDFDLAPSELAAQHYADEQALLSSGQPLINHEELSINPAGEYRWFLSTKVPLQDSTGKIIGLVGIGRDITERKQAEEQLRTYREHLEELVAARTAELSAANAQLQREIGEREQAEAALASERNLLRTLIDNLPDYIYVKDTASRFVSGNIAVARLMGAATPDDLIGKTDFDFYPPDMAAHYASDERAIIQSGQPLIDHEELVIDQLTGQQRWLSSTKVPLRDGQGQAVGLVGMSRDITERKNLEAQLRQSQKLEAIGRLAGGIAHDFNNLLTAILGYAELVLAELDEATPLRPDLQEIQNAGERAAALTRQLLAFSRQQVLQPALLDLNTVVADLSHMLRRLIGEDIDLIIHLRPDLGWIKADPGQLEQVILNLAVNARDAMPAGGKLTIETANVELDADYAQQHIGVKAGAYIMLAISDSGHGMDAATQARIFEPFFTTKEAGKGTGLGLAMVHGIVNQSGGHIWVYSEVGHGTTFKIYLPEAKVQEGAAQPRGALGTPAHGSETILLIEDDELVRQLAHTVLRKYSYTVLEASTGGEALQLAQAYPSALDLVVTDVIMPGGLNGPQVVEQLLALRPSLKVLYMSGYTDNAGVHRGVLEAGQAFLQKPFTPETLARKIREVLDA